MKEDLICPKCGKPIFNARDTNMVNPSPFAFPQNEDLWICSNYFGCGAVYSTDPFCYLNNIYIIDKFGKIIFLKKGGKLITTDKIIDGEDGKVMKYA